MPQHSYTHIEDWVAQILPQLKAHNFGLILGLVNHGVFPAVIVSQQLDKPSKFFKTEDLSLASSNEIKLLIQLSQKNNPILVCFDSLSIKNSHYFIKLQNLFAEVGATYKLLVIEHHSNANVQPDFIYFDAKLLSTMD